MRRALIIAPVCCTVALVLGCDPAYMPTSDAGPSTPPQGVEPCPSGTPPPAILPVMLPPAMVGVAYDAQLSVEGGDRVEFVRWLLNDGVPPPGTTFDIASGRVTGTPTAAGTYTFVVQANNMGGACIPPPSLQTFTITVS